MRDPSRRVRCDRFFVAGFIIWRTRRRIANCGQQSLHTVPIGLQKGLIQPAQFSMMAIITTLMTSPWFELVRRTKGKTDTEEDTAMVKA
jgi:hypothetical protein